jgi:hypothetical protein
MIHGQKNGTAHMQILAALISSQAGNLGKSMSLNRIHITGEAQITMGTRK